MERACPADWTMLEPKEGTKEGKKESAIAIGSKRSGGTWKNGGLVGYSLR